MAVPYRDVVMAELDLLGYYRLGEPLGADVAVDELGGFPGAFPPGANKPTLEQPGLVIGDPNTAALFNGDVGGVSGSYVDLGSRFTFEGRAPFAMEVSVKPLALAGTLRRIFDSVTPAGGGWFLSGTSTNIVFERFEIGVGQNDLNWGSPLQAGVETLLGLSYDGTTMRLYRNGVKAASDLVSTVSLPSDSILMVGNRPDLIRTWDGIIDELTFYSSELSDARFAVHFEAWRAGLAPEVEVNRVARAFISGEVSWAARPAGTFIVGASQLDSADVIGSSAFDEAWDGPYDALERATPGTAFPVRLGRWEINQGRSKPLAEQEAGIMTLQVKDPKGLLNPENPDSPLADDLRARLHPVRLRAEFLDVVYGLFFGWVRSIQWEPQGRRGISQLECIDLFYRLEWERPIIAATGATTTGAAIGLVLDAIDWTDPTLRILSVGDSIPNFSADGTKSGLQLIAGLLEAERGLFFQRGDGPAVYESRNVRLGKASQGTIADQMTSIVPGLEADSVRAKATVTRVGGVKQTFEDAAAALAWGSREETNITTPYLSTDTEALNLATLIVMSQREPVAPVRAVNLNNADPAILVHILSRQPGDRMELSESHPGGGMRDDYYIERRTLSGERSSIVASWVVAKAAAGSPFIIGTSTLDGTDTLAL